MASKISLYMETTKKEPEETLGEIQLVLRKFGARKFLTCYDEHGEIEGVSFTVWDNDKEIPFKLPINHKPIIQMFRERKTRYGGDERQAKRVAWRQILKWIEAQLALVQLQMVEIKEVFLPYLMVSDNSTLYQRMLTSGFKGYLEEPKG